MEVRAGEGGGNEDGLGKMEEGRNSWKGWRREERRGGKNAEGENPGRIPIGG